MHVVKEGANSPEVTLGYQPSFLKRNAVRKG